MMALPHTLTAYKYMYFATCVILVLCACEYIACTLATRTNMNLFVVKYYYIILYYCVHCWELVAMEGTHLMFVADSPTHLSFINRMWKPYNCICHCGEMHLVIGTSGLVVGHLFFLYGQSKAIVSS